MKKYTNEDIRLAAYYIWEQLGKPWGKEDECWNMALEQLMIYNTTTCSKKTKCATKKVAATTTKTTTKTTKASTIKPTSCTTKAKTTLKTPSTTRTSVKATSSNTTDFSHFRSNAGSLKSKVSLNTNKNINSNYSLKVAKKSLI